MTITPSASGRLTDYEIGVDQSSGSSENLIINSNLVQNVRDISAVTNVDYPLHGWDCWRPTQGRLNITVANDKVYMDSISELDGFARDVGLYHKNDMMVAANGKQVTIGITVDNVGAVPTYIRAGGLTPQLLDTVQDYEFTFTADGTGTVEIYSPLTASLVVSPQSFIFSKLRMKYGPTSRS